MAAPLAPPTIAPITAPRPPSNTPPRIAPAAPPMIAPPTGSCAAASRTGAIIAIASKAAAPIDRYIFSSSDNGNCNFPRVCGGREANHSTGARNARGSVRESADADEHAFRRGRAPRDYQHSCDGHHGFLRKEPYPPHMSQRSDPSRLQVRKRAFRMLKTGPLRLCRAADHAAASDVVSQEATDKAKVFISYSRKDRAFADRLTIALKERGFAPLIDRTDIYVFEDWWQRIQNLIVQADTILFVLSPDSVSSPVCKREVEFATSRNKRLAPIEICPVDTAIIPAALERCNFELFDNSEMFEQNVDRLAEALQLDIGWIRKHTEFGDQAHNWTAAGRPGGLLLRSPTLEEAEHWIASRPRNAPAPTPQTQAFIAESRRAASRQRDVLIGSLTAGLIAAIGLAGSALWQRWIAEGERVIAEEAKLTAQSESDRAKKTLEAAELLANALVVDF